MSKIINKSKKRVLYGSADYREIVMENGYFVDKTKYIEALERVKNPVFLRPRRFGKSLWCNILECYYDIFQKDDFEILFGHTYIGQNPTQIRNSFFILHLDFSTVEPGRSIAEIEDNFNRNCNSRMKAMIGRLNNWFGSLIEINKDFSASSNLEQILDIIWEKNLPKLYVIIDEYDNFANQLIVSNKISLYDAVTGDNSFLKPFFKTLKRGRKDGSIANVFITGVLPATLDDLISGFNIADYLTLNPTFECMLGFTQPEVSKLLDEVYRDYAIDPVTRDQVEAVIKANYDGYHFVNPDDNALYNSTILMYFLKWFTEHKEIPEYLTDLNLRTDFSWVKRITGANPDNTKEFLNTLNTKNRIPYDKQFLTTKFNMYQLFKKNYYAVSFFYLGMLTREDDFFLKLPNLNMQQIFVEYFNEIQSIDVSTLYAEMMQRFVNKPDLPLLFAEYWEHYISQLPESIFAHVNENFYRTTFFELCSRYLSKWFTWDMERSYPKGRTDLEFVGKFNEKYAGLRIVIEFKYLSNTKLKQMKTNVNKFLLRKKDSEQIISYVNDLKKSFSTATIMQYVIYCFGNKGFRVFEI